MASDEEHITRSLTLAREAAERGDDPFGSVLVHDGTRIAEERNAIHTEQDITAHPELRIARRAANSLSEEERREATLYTSTEPCAMCSGAIYISGIGRVVYSVSAETAASIAGGWDLVVPSASIFDHGDRDISIDGPVLETEGRKIHERCWEVSRNSRT